MAILTIRMSLSRTNPGQIQCNSDDFLIFSAGHYIFLEASNVAPGSKARLNKYQLPVSSEATVSFWYHMRGETMGTIRLIQENSGSEGSVHTK